MNLLGAVVGVALVGQATTGVDKSNWRQFMDAIMPTQSETSYQEIPWKSSLWAAAIEADKTEKPILLWTMNGHPLGCT